MKDGCYTCPATLTIKDGKAIVTIHTDFGLPDGSTISLAKQPEGSEIKITAPDNVKLFNGTAII